MFNVAVCSNKELSKIVMIKVAEFTNSTLKVILEVKQGQVMHI